MWQRSFEFEAVCSWALHALQVYGRSQPCAHPLLQAWVPCTSHSTSKGHKQSKLRWCGETPVCWRLCFTLKRSTWRNGKENYPLNGFRISLCLAITHSKNRLLLNVYSRHSFYFLLFFSTICTLDSCSRVVLLHSANAPIASSARGEQSLPAIALQAQQE